MQIAQAFGVLELWRKRCPEPAQLNHARQPRLREKLSAADTRRSGHLPSVRARLERHVFLPVGRRGVIHEFPIDDILPSLLGVNLGGHWQEFEEFTPRSANDAAERANFLTDNFAQHASSVTDYSSQNRPCPVRTSISRVGTSSALGKRRRLPIWVRDDWFSGVERTRRTRHGSSRTGIPDSSGSGALERNDEHAFLSDRWSDFKRRVGLFLCPQVVLGKHWVHHRNLLCAAGLLRNVNVIAMRGQQAITDVIPGTFIPGPRPEELDRIAVGLGPAAVDLQRFVEAPAEVGESLKPRQHAAMLGTLRT